MPPIDNILLQQLETELQQLETELKTNKIPVIHATSDSEKTKKINDALHELGAAFVPITSEQVKLIRQQSGSSMIKTFPHLPDHVKHNLTKGNFDEFNKYWHVNKLDIHRILHKSYGMPSMLPLSNNLISKNTDPILNTRMRFFPLAVTVPMLAWGNNILPISLLKNTNTICSFVNHDGLKTMAGVNATPIHYDGSLAQRSDPPRVQAILIDEAPNARHLQVIPNTQKIHEIFSKITGTVSDAKNTDKKRIFNTLKHPVLSDLIYRYGQHYHDGPYILLFIAGTIHFETVTANLKAPLFRLYCGWTTCTTKEVIENERISSLFYALHGYTIDSYSRCKSPLFVFERTTQCYTVREDKEDELLKNLKKTTINERRDYVLSNATPRQLKLAGLYHLRN